MQFCYNIGSSLDINHITHLWVFLWIQIMIYVLCLQLLQYLVMIHHTITRTHCMLLASSIVKDNCNVFLLKSCCRHKKILNLKKLEHIFVMNYPVKSGYRWYMISYNWNTAWLRDTVRQTSRGKSAAADFPRDVCLTVSRNQAVFLLSSTNV